MFLQLSLSSILTFPYIIVRMVSRRMCEGLVDSFGGEIYYVIKETNQSPEEMCGFMFGEACNKPYSDKWVLFSILIQKVINKISLSLYLLLKGGLAGWATFKKPLKLTKELSQIMSYSGEL